MNSEAIGNGLALKYSANRTEITLAHEDIKRIGKLLENLGRGMSSHVQRIVVTDEGISTDEFRGARGELVEHSVLNDDYIRKVLCDFEELLADHQKLRQTTIEAGLGNLTSGLSSV